MNFINTPEVDVFFSREKVRVSGDIFCNNSGDLEEVSILRSPDYEVISSKGCAAPAKLHCRLKDYFITFHSKNAGLGMS